MTGRVDTDQYATGLARCENWVCVNEGPLVKRPGFEYIRDAAPTASWLTAFRRSIDQEYALEWSELKLRFFTNGGRIETAPNVPYEIATPYAAIEAPRLSTQQSFDRLYIDHANHPPASIARLTASTFVHATTTLNNGPFLDGNSDEAITVQASAASGAGITLTASAAIFAASDVGSLFRIEAKDYSSVTAWEAGIDAVAIGAKRRSDGKVYEAETAGKTGTVAPNHSSGSEWDGAAVGQDVNGKGPFGIKWKYLHDRFGIVRITGFASATSVTADVIRRLPDQVVTAPSFRWAYAAFSPTRGWPSAVVHAFGRQLHFKDFDLFGTVVGDYGGGQNNYASFTSSGILAADLAFRRTLAVSDPPLWASSDNDKIIAGTATQELAIGALNNALAVSGDNIKASPQSRYGSEPVFPMLLGTNTVFIERGGRRIRSADYDFGSDRYVPVDLTAAARHITAGGITQLAYQRIPFGLLYAVRGDGQLAVHANTRLEIKGWERIVLGGGAKALSAVAIVGADNKTDALWLLIERQRADGLKREIWCQTPWRELGEAQDQSFYVDGGVRIAATAGQTSFSGLTHLAGQAVWVLADGGVLKGLTVSAGGVLTLPAASVPAYPFTVIVGLAYIADAITLRPEARVSSGTIQGLLQRVRKAALRLIETLGIRVGGSEGPTENVIDRPASAAMDAPIPLFTGDTVGLVDMEIARDGRARFVSEDPLPAVIASAVLSLEVDQGDA